MIRNLTSEQIADSMTNISSGRSTSCFDYALDCLGWFAKNLFHELNGQLDSRIWNLKVGIRLLKTIDLYIRECRRRSNQGTCLGHDEENRGDAKSDSLRLSSISFWIQDLAMEIPLGLESALLRYYQSSASDLSDIYCELTKIEENMRCIFETDIQEFNTTSCLLCYSLGDSQLVMDFFDSISDILRDLGSEECYEVDEALKIEHEIVQEKLMFLKSFIRFSMLQGVEVQQSKDLLVHIEVVAVNAASLMCRHWFQIVNKQGYMEMKLEISKLIHKKIDPVDPQVREIYIQVLTASKLSKSPYTFAMKENKHLVAEFIDYLLHSLAELLESYTSFLVPVKDRMLKLHEGLRFLIIFLSGQQEKFDKLNDEMKDLVGVVVCDAGIVIFSLSANEMRHGLCKETDLALSQLLEVLKLIIAEVGHVYSQPPSSSSLSFPRTNELGSLDFVLETLKELASSTADSIAFPYDQILTILEDLVFLRSFLGNIVEQRKWNEKLQALWSRVMQVAYSAELEIDALWCRVMKAAYIAELEIDSAMVHDQQEHCLDAVARDIKLVKKEAEEMHDSIRYNGEPQSLTTSTIDMPPQVTAPTFNEALVGLHDEVETIIDILTRGSSWLDVVAIVGMPGLGKTTLASNVYGHPSTKFHFHFRAWCTVSQVYSKHNLLQQILHGTDSSDQYREMNEDDLAQRLYQHLKGKRYIIVLDDVWDIEGWNLLKHSFPDDCNGSRILLTSRFQDLSLQIEPDSQRHRLRPLTDKESFELLQRKLFGKDGCPPTLSEVLLHVARVCKGLPLAVVLAAGILATTERDCWKEVARHLSSSNFVDDKDCMKTIEHSYNCLPDYLKPCLLYFGAFEEDQDIPVRKLLWLWMSEGLVQKVEGKRLEDVADDYLMDLTRRSLVMATQQRSLGGIKVCRIHDLIFEFCVVKAKEEIFLQNLRVDDLLTLDDLLTFTGQCNPHRLVIYPTKSQELKKSRIFLPYLRCLLFHDHCGLVELDGIGLKFFFLKLIRVLHLGNNQTLSGYFKRLVIFFVHLRYLHITWSGAIPSAIANLSRLETFVINSSRPGCLPNTIWNIKTLRHLVILWYRFGFRFPIDNLEGFPDLEYLDILSLAIDRSSQSLQKILTKIPSIRRLRCVGVEDRGRDGILVLDYLSRLESLTMRNLEGYEFEFPSNLRKLTLSHNHQPWSKISAIGKLPNLEVLKLCRDSFVGDKWEMEEGEFQNLRVLKLSGLNIRWWTASLDNLCCLEKLVLHYCHWLEGVPPCLGEALTLKMIEVRRCSESAVNSVKQIQLEQLDLGNKDLKIIID